MAPHERVYREDLRRRDPPPPPDICLQMQTYVFIGKHMSPTPTPTPNADTDNNRSAPPPVHTPEEAIYLAYTRRQGRADALKAIAKALAAGQSAERLLERSAAFAAATALWPESDRAFIPHPATWFNRGSYDDDPETWVRHRPTNNRVGNMTAQDHANGF